MKVVLTVLARILEGVLMSVGAFTLYDAAAKKWPDRIGVAVAVSCAVFAVAFFWVICLAPFIEGYREGKPRH